MGKWFRIFFTIVLLFCLAMPAGYSNAATARQQELTARDKAAKILAQMTPSEKVGQLFLVTFTGTNTDETSQIYKMISEQHIGGVVLRADNENFVGPENAIQNTYDLIRSLQVINWNQAQALNSHLDPTRINEINYIPLMVGISQEGDLAPYDQIINGTTPLPSEMAIGATWDPSNAESIGSILGMELNALGFNLLFGPSLDVLDTVKTDLGEDLGVRTFGGDPYWVAKMGQAYIKGVHEGSKNHMLVIATHFPGRGGSDRQPEDEVATVRKSLEQLKQIELAPFFAVTSQNADPTEVADGLLLSHIRYQGFQGNIRATTRPVSFDANAFALLMGLSEFTAWHQDGGIMVSDDLGSTAVRKFFDPMNSGFDARQVMKSALMAGNDLLYTGNITASGDADTYTTIVRTHDFFVQKYNEDSAFQQRVDDAVLRILTKKFEIYPSFQLAATAAQQSKLDLVGSENEILFEIARKSVTLISPDLVDMDSVLPDVPQRNERIIFISDKVPQKQCSTCADQTIFLAEHLRKAVEKLYGPQAGDQIQPSRLSTYSFENLQQLLTQNNPPETMENDLRTANWLVISFSDFSEKSLTSTVLRQLFSEQPDLGRNKKIIGFAFNAPYYLDATDISKFTAYYALYSKTPVFFDMAARVLFQDITPTGMLPVSMSSIGYDLIAITTPNPSQIIPLMVESVENSTEITETEAGATETPLVYKVGDVIPLTTGIIIDHNGNPVPDGTVVRFLIDTRSGSGSIEQIETQTANGVARTTYRIQKTGLYDLRVTADPAQLSQILSLDITDDGGQITSFEPTVSPTEGIASTGEAQNTPTPSLAALTNHQRGIPSGGDWLLSTLIIVSIAGLFYWWGWQKKRYLWNPRIPFLVVICGYLVYLFFAFQGSETGTRFMSNGSGILILSVTAGSMFGAGIGYLWYRMSRPHNE